MCVYTYLLVFSTWGSWFILLCRNRVYYCVGIIDLLFFFFFQAEDGIRDYKVTGVQTCALPIYGSYVRRRAQGNTLLKFSAAPEIEATNRSEVQSSGAEFPSGKYQVYFEGEDRNQSAVVATFWTKGESLYGTFIAPDGDYGLLVGNLSGGKVQLNRFTGWQAIAMTLEEKTGMWSGNYFFQNDKPRGFLLSPRPNIDSSPLPNRQTTMKNPAALFAFEG